MGMNIIYPWGKYQTLIVIHDAACDVIRRGLALFAVPSLCCHCLFAPVSLRAPCPQSSSSCLSIPLCTHTSHPPASAPAPGKSEDAILQLASQDIGLY